VSVAKRHAEVARTLRTAAENGQRAAATATAAAATATGGGFKTLKVEECHGVYTSIHNWSGIGRPAAAGGPKKGRATGW
jgi:hypothetical protein